VEQRREQIREQILEAARIALTRDGYERITTRRIAEEAGINVATLHYHFGTKEILLSEVVSQVMRAAEIRLRGAIAPAQDAPEALRLGLEEVWKIVLERPGVLRYDVAVRGLRDENARRDAASIYSLLYRMVEEIVGMHLASGGTLTEDVTPHQLAYYVVAAVDGVILHHTIFADDAIAKWSIERILQHALTMMEVES
jgi:AcrR family transcriptional regulator